MSEAFKELLKVAGEKKYKTVLADPPWRFKNRTWTIAAPEYKRLYRYPTMALEEIMDLPVDQITDSNAHLYLWVPNALLKEGIEVLEAWGFTYKTNIVWYKVTKDGRPDRRGMGFYFRNVTELILFGVKGKMRTLKPGRTMPNIIVAPKTVHSRKPDEVYCIIEQCSPGPYIELFARSRRPGWTAWGNEVDKFTNSTNLLFPKDKKVMLVDGYLNSEKE